jgi:hypothetical protein
MKLFILSAVFLVLSCSAPEQTKSTACYGISELDSMSKAKERLEVMLERGGRWTGLADGVAKSLAPTESKAFRYDEGDGYSFVRVKFTTDSARGELYAFVYEDCSIEWSPQFR